MAGPIEAKVTFATAATYLGSTALLTTLTTVQSDPGLVGFLPAYVAPWVLSLLPTAVTFVTGYRTRHTPQSPTADTPPIS